MSKIAEMLAHILVFLKNCYSQGYLCEICYLLLKTEEIMTSTTNGKNPQQGKHLKKGNQKVKEVD